MGSGEPPMLLHVISSGLSSVAMAILPGDIIGGWGGVKTVKFTELRLVLAAERNDHNLRIRRLTVHVLVFHWFLSSPRFDLSKWYRSTRCGHLCLHLCLSPYSDEESTKQYHTLPNSTEGLNFRNFAQNIPPPILRYHPPPPPTISRSDTPAIPENYLQDVSI
uniref:Uncharacterized protein n=1 Tax=Glossina austeni TaxID=7395 RepID=A0A1A9UGT4_GLOAU